MRIQVTLTPSESKRLIGRAVANMEVVRKAYKNGVLCVALGTTNAYVVEELTGEKVAREKFAAGVILPERTCVTPRNERSPEYVFKEGRRVNVTAEAMVEEMSAGDVFIKGGNALDPYGNVGIFLGSETGGTIGRTIGKLMARGIQIVIPIGLEKLIPVPIEAAAREAGIFKMDKSLGTPVGLMPISGMVVTELRAISILTGAWATPIGAGGVNRAEGAVTIVIEGTEEEVGKAHNIIQGIKGEPPVKTIIGNCEDCHMEACPYKK